MSFWNLRAIQRLAKPVKYWFGTAQRIHGVILIDETAGIGIAQLPLHTGFLPSEQSKRAWASLYKLTCRIKGKEGRYLPISERTYIPLDPLGRLTDEEKRNLIAISDIAAREHDRSWAEINSAGTQTESYKFLKTTMIVCGIICVLFGLIHYFKG